MIRLSAEEVARTSSIADVALARRIDEGGGLPRRSCTGARPEPNPGGHPARIPNPETFYWRVLAFRCVCGRFLDWDGSRWGCGACE